MKHFAFKPSITLKGRKNHGLRGFSGKPFHPPLTDIPIGAYILLAFFDLVSFIAFKVDSTNGISESFRIVGSWLLGIGLVVSLFAVLTGWADWHRTSEPGNQARRTINSHAIIMIGVFVLAVVEFIVRLTAFTGLGYSSPVLVILSLLIAFGISLGATYGGSLVFDYGFNVETAGDSPVWHESEVNLLPGEKPAQVKTPTSEEKPDTDS